MTLAARLLLAFGFVAILATALVGAAVREATRRILEADFEDRIASAASGASQELAFEIASLRDLLGPLCRHDTFVDRAHLALDRARGDASLIDPGVRIALRHLVPEQALALKLDSLSLVAGDGTILGASEEAKVGTRDRALGALVKKAPGPPSLVASAPGGPRLVVHCARQDAGITVGLVATRKLEPVFSRIGEAYQVRLGPEASSPSPRPGEIRRTLELEGAPGLRVALTLSRERLVQALGELDRAIFLTGVAALSFALAIAFLLARSLSRPIVALARQSRSVLEGEPNAVSGRGGKEIAELADAFNRSISELAAMRRRLAATERISARREVARQIAHEIKNPLAPIRAAVETLRRLRARDDPAFDDYFEEATQTVLQEVHRISNIVSEFTRFARLPAPNPAPIDLVAVVRGVVTLHARLPEGMGEGAPSGLQTGRGGQVVDLEAESIPEIVADKDQIVQVLTNLIQNGLEAAAAVRPDPKVSVKVGMAPAPGASGARVRIVVSDNGPGVSPEMQARLFEPYATSKAKGTGLGLAIAARIVFEHGGEIAYRPGEPEGAIFEILLPVSGPPLLEKPPAEITQRPV